MGNEPGGWRSVAPDILRGVAAGLIGLVVLIIADGLFHDRAFYFFHDARGIVPDHFYRELNSFFIALPYVAAGIVAGGLAGAGRMTGARHPLARLAAWLAAYGAPALAYTLIVHNFHGVRLLLLLLPGLPAFALGLAVDLLYRHADGRYK